MQCYVYKSAVKEGNFLYLPSELDESVMKTLPQGLLALLGELSFVVEFELTAARKLAQVDSEQVLQSIEEAGYFLQMPSKDAAELEDKYFS